jgi:hypothetical protein
MIQHKNEFVKGEEAIVNFRTVLHEPSTRINASGNSIGCG